MIRFLSPLKRFSCLGTVAALSLAAGMLASAQTRPDSQLPRDAATLRAEALAAMEAGDDDQAFRLARTAMRVAPDDPQVVFLMALMLGERNRFPEAIKMLDDLAEKVPSVRLPVFGQTAQWMVKFGMWSDAEQRYRTILASVPDSVLVHRDLAQLFLRQGRRQEAVSHLRQLCRLGNVKEEELRALLNGVHPLSGDADSEAMEPIGVLGNARREIAKGSWNAAVEILQQRADQSDVAAAALLGRCFAQQRDFEALGKWVADNAKADTAKADTAKADTAPADFWFALGVHQAHGDDHRAAVKSFCTAVLLDQTDHQAYSQMSLSLERLDAADQAREASQRAEMIERTQILGSEMAAVKERDIEKITTLINLLDELHRPLEALSWRGVRLAYESSRSTLSEADAKQVLSDIIRDRDRLLESDQVDPTEQFLLCGVDLEALERNGTAPPGSEVQP